MNQCKEIFKCASDTRDDFLSGSERDLSSKLLETRERTEMEGDPARAITHNKADEVTSREQASIPLIMMHEA